MNLTSVPLSRLPHKEYIECMRAYLNVFDVNDPVTLGLDDQFNALTDKIDEIESIYKRNRASELTKVIAELDATRDRYLIGIALLIDAYKRHYDESKVQSAERLANTFSVYGTPSSIAHESLQGETTTINNLVEDFQGNPLQADLVALGLTDWVGQLQIVNNDLRTAYWDRASERGDAPLEKVSDLRIEGNDLYYTLRDHMMAKALLVNYAAPYDKIIRDLNALSDMYNQTLARRSGGTTPNPEDGGGDGGE